MFDLMNLSSKRVLRCWLSLALVATAFSPGCSIKKIAINKLGNTLAGSPSTFSSDNDPELVRDAAPFSLKLMETLLLESPRHRGLLLAVASGFATYSYAFVHQDADQMEETDLAAAERLRARARRLYLRARDYGLQGLGLEHPGFEAKLREAPEAAVEATDLVDLPFLFWTAVGWGGIISLSKDDPAMIGEQPLVEALIDRALELDEAYNQGVIHTILIAYEMARPGAAGDRFARARSHFERAVELSKGQQAAPLVAYAEAVAVQKQDRREFESVLNQALAIDTDLAPDSRLLNLVVQDRARWLLSRMDELFLSAE